MALTKEYLKKKSDFMQTYTDLFEEVSVTIEVSMQD